METGLKRRRLYKSQSIICLDGLSSYANATDVNTNDQRITEKPTSNFVKAPLGQRLFSLVLPALDSPTKRTSLELPGGFLQACHWCKKKIEKDRYMYGYV